MIAVRTAAKYLIQRYEQEFGSTMDEMKLHKLLYFTQRESFVLLGKLMFLDKFDYFVGWGLNSIARKGLVMPFMSCEPKRRIPDLIRMKFL